MTKTIKMLTVLLLAFCFLTSANIYAQDIDGLLKQAHDKRSSDIPEFVRILGELEGRNAELSAYQTDFLRYLQAYYTSISGNYAQGIEDYKSLIESTPFDDVLYRSLYSLVNNYGVDRDFYNGSIYLKRLFELRPQITDPDLVDVADMIAALFYNESSQYEQAKQQAELILARDISQRNRCIADYVVVNASFQNQLNELSLRQVDDAMDICKQIDETIMHGFVAIIKARLYLQQGNSAAGYGVLKSIEEGLLSTKYPRVVSSFYAIKAEVELALERLDEAKSNAYRALDFSQSATFSKPAVEAYKVLYRIAQQENNVEQALKYYVSYAEADKAYLDDLALGQFAVQQAQHDAEVNRQQLELANQQNDLLSVEALVAKQTAEKNLIALILISVILLLVVIWAYKSHRLHIQMKELAEIDGLTGLKNRRQFYIEAEAKLMHCKKSNQPVSLVILDLDFFKNINDSYGHIIGDWALKAVAETLNKMRRKSDVLGRLGGEEFGILLPNCNQEMSVQIAEDCRSAIAAIDSAPSGYSFSITASLGVAECYTGDYQFDALFTQSDTALYRSKSEGRNRVFAYSSLEPEPA